MSGFDLVSPEIVPVALKEKRKLLIPISKLLSFDYVRETVVAVSNVKLEIEKKKRPLFGEQHGTIYGYAAISHEGKYYYKVACWWHKHHDRDILPSGPYKLSEAHKNLPEYRRWGPCEAVTPLDVLRFFPEFINEV